ncbi:MAG: Gx transporter family protein [Ruminococcus sp.]|jgi:heptaprenyl diphosphate synthase|nr:Gx transporter family protein [Ruminococcus sp.]
MKLKRLTQLALLTAMSLTLFVIELRIPELVPIPGVKLGLANIVTVYAVYRFRAWETALLVLSRLLLGAWCTGNPSALLYSLAGAAFCLCGMLLLRRIIPQQFLWLSSVFGAIFHNTGQILAAMLLMQTRTVLAYYPILLVTGCIAGGFTGLCAQLVIGRTKGKLP